ncbi:MAG TPA: redoxin domain-containing protein [bacterium]|nr:redoxin domain-containing protein [bacterium]
MRAGTRCGLIIIMAAGILYYGPTPMAGAAEGGGLLTLGVKVGSLAPEFTFQDASGKWVSLSDFRGKKVFLFSWSSMCRCKYQLPALEELYQAHKGEGFEVLAVAADAQGFKWAQPYLDIAHATYPALSDPNNELGIKYNFLATENGWLIDEGGVVRMNAIGFNIALPEQKALLLRLMGTDFKAEDQKSEKEPLAARIKAAEGLVAKRSGDFAGRLNLAELYRQDGELKKAESVLRDGLKKRPLSAEAHYRLGVVLYQQGRVEDAVKEWDRAYALEPTNYIYMRNVQAYHDPDKFYAELK